MPLPDYSKFKADIRKPKPSEVRRAKGCFLEQELGSLPLASMDDEAARGRRRSSGEVGYNMGFDLEISHPQHSSDPDLLHDASSLHDSSSLRRDTSSYSLGREGSLASLSDPFYDEEEEEEVTESYHEEDSSQNFNDSRLSIQSSQARKRRGKSKDKDKDKDGKEDGKMSKSASDASIGSRNKKRLPENVSRRMNHSNPDLQQSFGSMDSSNARKKAAQKSLGDFLDKSIKKGRKKTALLPGSTTEDLCSEMNEVVSMLSSKRGGSTRREGSALRTSGGSRGNSRDAGLRSSGASATASSTSGPPLRRSETDSNVTNRGSGKLRDYSQASASSRLRDYSAPNANARGSGSHSKSPGPSRRTPRRSSSHEDAIPTGGTTNVRRSHSEDDKLPRRGMPPKSRSADGSSKRHIHRTTTDPKDRIKPSSHTHQSFVTGSRIRRITPGESRSNLGASMSSFGASASNLTKDGSFRGGAAHSHKHRGVSPSGKGHHHSHPHQRSVSPKARKHKEKKEHKKEKVSDSEVPPLLFS